ncbi:MAG: hypothetical protein M9895_05115 [Aquamicrobium sp.]|uniref:hypothetical protein n=1 Tax=Aquamicrobium sp. TaxID=1872579 RepID=UPI00349EC198|nr:hypothetical protein [Aquamicrobium sp.]MCO5158971.1 hypothetical protein [Aquamicrobium sp.]
MAKLPPNLSLQAFPIEEALAEGRKGDAERLICEILLSGKADNVVQRLAAEMIRPPKKGKGRPKSLPQHWFDIGTDFDDFRSRGMKYEEAMRELERRYGFSDATLRKAITFYNDARSAHDAATAEYYD